MTQIWLAVDEDGEELAFSENPERSKYSGWVWSFDCEAVLPLPSGTIEKIIGNKLTWKDEAVEVSDEV